MCLERAERPGRLHRLQLSTFDLNGNRKTQIEVNGGAAENTAYTYDSDDRLQQAAYNRLTEKTLLTSGSAGTDRTYAYNPRYQLIGITDNRRV